MKSILNEIKAMNSIAGTKLTKEQEVKIIKERLGQLNEASLASYYNRANAPVKSIAKKVDQMLNDLIKDKGQMAKLIDAITDLADEYAQERIDNLDSERN
jgi:DNA-binding ferritin-like protein